MTHLELVLCRYYLPKVLARRCGDTIPRSGKEGENVNCFGTNVDDNGKPYLWIKGINGDEIKALQWDGQSFSIESSINLAEIRAENLFVRHFYGLEEVRYTGIYDFAIGQITRWPYVKIISNRFLNRLDQYWFNKKKVFTKQRIDLLKLLIQKHLEGKTPVGSFQLMSDLYSAKWVLHPEGDAQHRKVRLYLDSLARSGDLQVRETQYLVTGEALRTIETYEEEERKHTENVKMQRRMIWLTLAIALLTCVQAGLIKAPVLLDFSFCK